MNGSGPIDAHCHHQPLQKRSKNYKGVHRTSASFALLSFLWLWQEESWEISCQSYKFLQFLQIQFLPFCWPPCFWRKRDVPSWQIQELLPRATFQLLFSLFFLLKISLIEMLIAFGNEHKDFFQLRSLYFFFLFFSLKISLLDIFLAFGKDFLQSITLTTSVLYFPWKFHS